MEDCGAIVITLDMTADRQLQVRTTLEGVPGGWATAVEALQVAYKTAMRQLVMQELHGNGQHESRSRPEPSRIIVPG